MSFNRELFIEAGAHQMSATRPDIWTLERARKDLRRWLSEVESAEVGASMGTGGFMLLWTVDASRMGEEKEFALVQSVVDYAVFPAAGIESTFVWESTGGDKIPQPLVDSANNYR